MDHGIDVPGEIHRAPESRIGTPVVVVVKLLRRDAEFFDHVLVLNARADQVGPVALDEHLQFQVADVIDHQAPRLHVGQHALVMVDQPRATQLIGAFRGKTRAVLLRVRLLTPQCTAVASTVRVGRM